MPLGVDPAASRGRVRRRDTGGASTVSRDLAILHAILDSAEREELIDATRRSGSSVRSMPRRKWRLLEPHEVPAVSKAFTDEGRAGCS